MGGGGLKCHGVLFSTMTSGFLDSIACFPGLFTRPLQPCPSWGRGIVGILTFLFPKTGYMPPLRGTFYIQSSAKSPAPIPAGHCKLTGSVWAWKQNPWHCRDSAEVKTLQFSPATPPTIPGPEGDVVVNNYAFLV